MVMHARKIPRLNDGYYDSRQTHSYEDKHPSKSRGHYNDRYLEKSKSSPAGYSRRDDGSSRHDSPRYSNKQDRDMRDRASPGDKRGASYSGGSSNRSTNHDRGYKDAGRGNKDQKERDHKAEILKSAICVCGDWSEHISSSGKQYYYNCKTEVSKWEKPKEWVDKPKEKKDAKHTGGKYSDGPKHSSGDRGGGDSGSRSSSSRQYQDRGGGSSHNNHNSCSSSAPTDKHKELSSSSMSRDASSSGQRPSLQQHQTWQGYDSQSHRADRDRDNSSHAGGHPSPHVNTNRVDTRTGGSADGRSGYGRYGKREEGSTPNNSTTSKMAAGNGGVTYEDMDRQRYRNETEDFHQSDDMDISPGSTPTEESMMERISCIPVVTSGPGRPFPSPGTHPLALPKSPGVAGFRPSGALPSLISRLGDKGLSVSLPNPDNRQQNITQQAIQTLQKLQQALLVQQQQQVLQKLQQLSGGNVHNVENDVSCPSPPSPTESEGTPLGSPNYEHANSNRLNDDRDGRDSPRSDRSLRSSRRGSPAPSHTSSQGASVGTSQLSAAGKRHDTIELTPSLANYYNDKLTDHISGWQDDHTERQALRHSEEAIIGGGLMCSQVTVDLKKVRSLVRISEIQSTLQEQRILFIRQQIKDLENVRSQNTFMPFENT